MLVLLPFPMQRGSLPCTGCLLSKDIRASSSTMRSTEGRKLDTSVSWAYNADVEQHSTTKFNEREEEHTRDG